jgi:hypothetical protein
MTRIAWIAPRAPDVESYQLRWGQDFENLTWNNMQIVVETISANTNTVSVHSRSGVYALRARDRAGNWSEAAYTKTLVGLPPTVDSSYEMSGPPWSGTFERVELNADGNLILSKDPTTGRYYPTGVFSFSNPLSLTETWGVRMEANLEMTSFPDDAESMTHDAQVILAVGKTVPVLSSPWFTPLQTARPLAGSPSAFADWTTLITEWVDGRVFYTGVWLRSFDGLVTPVVKNAKAEIFFDPRQEQANDVPATGGILSVIYRHPFVEVPGLQITLNNGGRTDFVTRTSSTIYGFTLEIRDGNNQLVSGRNIDWVATGYGIGIGG